MSESITLTTATATIYGSRAGARAYLGVEHEEWDLASDGDVTLAMRRALAKATRFLDRQAWAEDYATFAARDALDTDIGDGDAAFPFRAASYELAVLVLEDETALEADDSAQTVSSISAGGDSVTYRNDASTPEPIPGVAMSIVGKYLASAAVNAEAAHPGTGDGETGCSVNPFGSCRDYDKTGAW